MELEFKLAVFVIFVLSFVAGWLICKGLYERRNIGTLRIDRSDPEEPPYFFLEVTNARMIQNGKPVILHVKEQNYISQK